MRLRTWSAGALAALLVAASSGATLAQSIDDIPAEGLRFNYSEGPFEEEGILLKLADGEVRAYKNECRHLPRPSSARTGQWRRSPSGWPCEVWVTTSS